MIMHLSVHCCFSGWLVGWFIVFDATFNNISVISWRSALLMVETGGHNNTILYHKIPNVILVFSAFICTTYVIKYIMHILGLYSCIHFVFPTLKLQYAAWNRYPEEAVLNLNSSRYLHVYLQQTSNFSLWIRNWEIQHQPQNVKLISKSDIRFLLFFFNKILTWASMQYESM